MGSPTAVFELIMAISNKQVGAQMTEWAVNGVVQALRQEVRPRAADREPLLTAQVNRQTAAALEPLKTLAEAHWLGPPAMRI
jgi:hypothetical protein